MGGGRFEGEAAILQERGDAVSRDPLLGVQSPSSFTKRTAPSEKPQAR